MTEVPEISFYSELIEAQGKLLGDKPYIFHEDLTVSYAEFDRMTCRVANGMAAQGASPGEGVAIFMGNCVEYLYLFYGLPRGGFYSVPINTGLKGDGLRYIIEHSDVKTLVVDDTLYPRILDLGSPLGAVKKVFVRRTEDKPFPPEVQDIQDLMQASPEKPKNTLSPSALSFLMYTSGTTGFPKGVVNRNHNTNIPGLKMLSAVLYQPQDVLYTTLPLFHANALMLTPAFAMAGGLPFALEKKFSASGFWDSTRRYGGTSFNALGAMVPILMKQPEKPDDADNPVRLVISAACPANLWEAFEKRFNVKIWEAYGAVDGGGALTFNFGNAPVGSIGQFVTGQEWRIVDDDDHDVKQGEIGELITKVMDGKKGSVEYYKNPEASQKKVRGGWIYTGDLFYADPNNNLYFVDRKTDSMRRRGENISSFEVENMVEKCPPVAECAAFGVPSELGEDEVMIWVKPKPGETIDLKALVEHCAKNMAYFMVPRYVDIVDDIPRTGTLRVQKSEMKKRGVTGRTWDREKEMPDFKPR
ncbi:MAG: AMP-binding protein [Desulfobacterales bacterium]